MAIPLHTFGPTGDPCVDDLNHRLTGEFPTLRDWFAVNAGVLKHPPENIIADSEPYFAFSPPAEPGIYFLIDAGRIVYIGKALSIVERLSAHRYARKPFTHYWCFGGVPYEWLGHVEGFYIKRCRPRLNSMHVSYSRDLDSIAKDMK